MNKNITIEHFCLTDYNTLLKVVAKYIEVHQMTRNKLPYEKDVFDLTDIVFSLETYKHAVEIEIENHWKPFFVQVKETKTQYKFKIWYAR